MNRWCLLIAMAAVACGGGKPKSSTSSSGDLSFANSSFVEISLDEETSSLEELIGSELSTINAQCGDLQTLEPMAMMGQLTDPQIRCLDDRLKESDRQTAKNKLSIVLMNDAFSKGDEHRWETITRRHLEEIDRSNPDLCYRFAYYLSKQAPDNMDEAMKWADVALDNRARWEGETHVKRVYSLYKTKATAAQRKWTWLEEEYTKTPSESLMSQMEEARNQTKTLAREWLEYARQSSQDDTLPANLCKSASGTSGFCDDL
jgi:hypothetical protein